MTKEKHWCVVHTQPNTEKRVSLLLTKKKIETYCPVTKVSYKKVTKKTGLVVPLFPSCVFIHTLSENYNLIKQTEGVVDFLFWLTEPAIINPEEIAALKYYASDGYNVTVQKTLVNGAEPVNVTNCLFTGVGEDGRMVNEKYIKIYLPSLGYTICALPNNKVQVLKAVGKFEQNFIWNKM